MAPDSVSVPPPTLTIEPPAPPVPLIVPDKVLSPPLPPSVSALPPSTRSPAPLSEPKLTPMTAWSMRTCAPAWLITVALSAEA
ncbi:hypothetical protein D3C71_1052730 [compost metagenome]